MFLLIGGHTGDPLSPAWERYGSAWTNVSPGGMAGMHFPTTRDGHALAYDSARGVVVLFGGDDIGSYFSDTWEYRGGP